MLKQQSRDFLLARQSQSVVMSDLDNLPTAYCLLYATCASENNQFRHLLLSS